MLVLVLTCVDGKWENKRFIRDATYVRMYVCTEKVGVDDYV